MTVVIPDVPIDVSRVPSVLIRRIVNFDVSALLVLTSTIRPPGSIRGDTNPSLESPDDAIFVLVVVPLLAIFTTEYPVIIAAVTIDEPA